MPVEPDEFYDGVGRVVVEAARMEYQLASLVSEVAGTPIAAYLASGQSFSALCQMIEALLKSQHLPSDLTDQIKSAISDARGLQGKRDAVVHGIWVGEQGVAVRIAHRPRRHQLNMTPHPFTRAELLNLAHDLGVMSARLFSLGWNTSAALGSGMEPMPIPDDLRDQVHTGHWDLPNLDGQD